MLPAAAGAQPASPENLAPAHLVLIEESLQIVQRVGDQVWPGWAQTPKTTLIVGDTHEHVVMIGPRTELPESFVPTRQKLGPWPIFARERTLSPSLRAAFPIEGAPMAVVGRWDPAEESPNEWAISLVEQWFHLLQIQRGEQRKVSGLAIEAAETPAWRVDYSFPFDDPDVGNAMVLLGVALYDFGTLAADLPRSSQRSFQGETARAALSNLRTVLQLKYGPEAYAFFRLRTWREGVARYSSVMIARLMAAAEERGIFESSEAFRALPEHRSYRRVWRDSFANQIWLIRTAQLDSDRHLPSFDALGHGMAVMLDVVQPEWKASYFEPDVWLDDLIAAGLESLSETPRASARR